MFPHPDIVFEMRTVQNRELLAEAAQERLANEATSKAPTLSWIDSGRASVRRILTGISAIAASFLSTRRLAKAWS